VAKGVEKAGADLGVSASIINPTTDDPAEQVRAVEDLIAKKVDVIGVVPNDAKAVEPVLGRAQAAGIKVIMNESPGQKNADWNIELIQDHLFRGDGGGICWAG
jgi:simple sugar transport system substrate-binding protein